MAELKADLASRRAEFAVLADERDRLEAKLDAVTAKAEELAAALEFIRLQRAGARSERYASPDQAALPFDETLPPGPLERVEADEGEAQAKPTRDTHKRGTPKRRSLADNTDLPHQTVPCALPSGACCAGCGQPLRVIGAVTSHRLEWVPGHFLIHDVVREKAACPRCPSEGVFAAPAPYALDRALCGNGLLARVLTGKFADHIPLNRQSKRMAREGVELSTQTMCGWLAQGAELMRPLYKALLAQVLVANTLQADDTGHPVQDGEDGTLRRGRMWVLTDQEHAVYAFTATKEGEHPAKLLEGFRGQVLLVDGGSEFNQVVRDKALVRAGCWSHLRRYFFEARHESPRGVHEALALIRDLFLLERDFAGLSVDERLRERQAHSAPLVDALQSWVRDLRPHVRPSSRLGEALTYATNQADAMRVFLARGDVPLHNNLSELLLRQPVVGRKNWLFSRTEGGAEA
ncbi:MAG: IS66 family transposase, partial [Opitutaceae bacterium]|nr:IS66 family transposase [Opitutaceae bacterium]